MQIMRLVGGIMLIMLLLSNTAYSQADQYPNIVWTEYAISETTGQNIWNKVKLYRNNHVSELKLDLEDEEVFLLPNLQDISEICFAIKEIGGDTYTISALQDDSLRTLFSLQLHHIFAFLGFQEQRIYFVRRYVEREDSTYTYAVFETTPDTETELIRYKSQNWNRPSVNANGDILYTVTDDQSQRIMLRLHSGEVREIAEGCFPIWYDSNSFLYILDNKLYKFNFIELISRDCLTESGVALSIQLNPYSGNSLYLTADKKNLIYGILIEDKLFGFIPSGYFHKSWNVVSLQSGDEYTIGSFGESYDNIHVY